MTGIQYRDLPLGLLYYTDRGSPPGPRDKRHTALTASGIDCSASRQGDCWDNTIAESFFTTIKSDWPNEDSDLTPRLACAQLVDDIDTFDNLERRRSNLDYARPIEYEWLHIVDQQGIDLTCQ